MPDSLGKPFTAQELWGCLLKYFTPVGTSAINEQEQLSADEKLQYQLRKNFLEDNSDSFKKLTDAIAAGDTRYAHRIAHTLKGIAGTLDQKNLRRAAYEVEHALQYGKNNVNEEQLDRLNVELSFVIEEFTRMMEDKKQADGSDEKNEKKLDKAQALELLYQLKPILKIGDSDCLDLVDDLRAIPETEELISRMEHFDFAAAYEIITLIIQKLEDGDDG
jgi:HPt (histidine-containing phosphotransfer) domain-containing protein